MASVDSTPFSIRKRTQRPANQRQEVDTRVLTSSKGYWSVQSTVNESQTFSLGLRWYSIRSVRQQSQWKRDINNYTHTTTPPPYPPSPLLFNLIIVGYSVTVYYFHNWIITLNSIQLRPWCVEMALTPTLEIFLKIIKKWFLLLKNLFSKYLIILDFLKNCFGFFMYFKRFKFCLIDLTFFKIIKKEFLLFLNVFSKYFIILDIF